VEKIRTIGDNYMIASGLPRQIPDHALLTARLALEMFACLETLPSVDGHPLNFRIGINAGPVIAGVVGHKKFQYDVWGDTVNIASRMETQGEPGKIQVTQAFYELIKDSFVCEPKGQVEIKGKGMMETWFLVRERNGGNY
jgi:class 3 adenylate cyclase